MKSASLGPSDILILGKKNNFLNKNNFSQFSHSV